MGTIAACIAAAKAMVLTPSNKPSEIPGCPILNANKGPNGPSICMVAASPVVIVVLVAFLAASTKRLWLGASSLRKKSIDDIGLFASDRHDGGLSHTKWMVGVAALQYDSNRESLIQTHPVQSLFDVWQATDSCAVLLKESPPNALHLTLEASPRITQ